MVDRVYQRNASGSVPDAPADPSIGYPTNGNPSQGVPATMPGEYWYYMITEALRKVIVDAGLVPDHLDVGLFASAIQQAFTNRLADNVQAQDHLNDTLALSPASLIAGVLGAGSVGTNGYLALPYRDVVTGALKKVIIQYVSGSGSSGSAVNLPIAFPNAALGIGGLDFTGDGASASTQIMAYSNLTSTSVTLHWRADDGSLPPSSSFSIIVIGH